jgi:hypothetical protein
MVKATAAKPDQRNNADNYQVPGFPRSEHDCNEEVGITAMR